MSGCCGDACAPAPTETDARFRRILWIVLALNAAMFVVEGLAGWLGRSTALQGDALDFLGDAANYGVALFVLGRTVRWKAGAAMVKGLTMGAFGLFVLGMVAWRAWSSAVPEPAAMGIVGLLALAVNLSVALMLYRFRQGDANMRSVWICSRNDAIANIGVIAAGGLVAVLNQGWPDWVVGLLIAAIALQGAYAIVRQARGELAEDRAAREQVHAAQ